MPESDSAQKHLKEKENRSEDTWRTPGWMNKKYEDYLKLTQEKQPASWFCKPRKRKWILCSSVCRIFSRGQNRRCPQGELNCSNYSGQAIKAVTDVAPRTDSLTFSIPQAVRLSTLLRFTGHTAAGENQARFKINSLNRLNRTRRCCKSCRVFLFLFSAYIWDQLTPWTKTQPDRWCIWFRCGGLRWPSIRQVPAHERLIYLAIPHLPYGDKSKETIWLFCRYYRFCSISNGKVVVVACNTASSKCLCNHVFQGVDEPCVDVINPVVESVTAVQNTNVSG